MATQVGKADIAYRSPIASSARLTAFSASLSKEAFNPFIIFTSVDKADAKTRKLIRSHVMLGKNRGKRRTAPSKPVRKPSNTTNEASLSTSSSSEEDVGRPVVPVKLGNEYSLLKLAAAVDPLVVKGFLECQYDLRDTPVRSPGILMRR